MSLIFLPPNLWKKREGPERVSTRVVPIPASTHNKTIDNHGNMDNFIIISTILWENK